MAGVMFAERDYTHFPTGVPIVRFTSSTTSYTTAPHLLVAVACSTSENVGVTNQFDTEYDILEVSKHFSELVEHAVLSTIKIFGLAMAITQSVVKLSSRSHTYLCARQWIFLFRLILRVGTWATVIAAYLKLCSLQNWLAATPWPEIDAESD